MNAQPNPGDLMHDETTVPGPEFRVRPVIRYVVTRYFHPYLSRDGSHGSSGRSEVVGEFHNEDTAREVAYSMMNGMPEGVSGIGPRLID